MQHYVMLNWVRGTAAGLESPVLRILTGSRGLRAAGGGDGGWQTGLSSKGLWLLKISSGVESPGFDQ